MASRAQWGFRIFAVGLQMTIKFNQVILLTIGSLDSLAQSHIRRQPRRYLFCLTLSCLFGSASALQTISSHLEILVYTRSSCPVAIFR